MSSDTSTLRPSPASHLSTARPMSAATRLMSAGAYLEPEFRKAVIRELLGFRFRAVAPSYGYDAVTVLAHALAARRLRRQQVGALVVGVVVLFVLTANGVVNPVLVPLLVIWLAWAAAFLRRVATLQTLVTDLKPRGGGGLAAGGAYPRTPGLTPDAVERISRQQAAHTGLVHYSGFEPFVGAGAYTDRWAVAEVIKPAPANPLLAAAAGANGQLPNGNGPVTREPGLNAVIPFSVDDLILYVDRRMRTVLRDAASAEESIKTLEVERRWYQHSISLVPVRRRRFRKAVVLPAELPDAGRGASDGAHGGEYQDAAREYLCIRVGSWDQELVTSMYAGFDLRGDTLHVEFNTYVLLPIRRSFHLVDRLPDALGARLLLRVGRDVILAAPGEFVRFGWRRTVRGAKSLFQPRNLVDFGAAIPDHSEQRLGRYMLAAANRGAHTSIRQMAAESVYYSFFQTSDRVKYMQIVEQQLMESIELFLMEHNVDLASHRAASDNILYGDINNNFGTAEVVGRSYNRGTKNGNDGGREGGNRGGGGDN